MFKEVNGFFTSSLNLISLLHIVTFITIIQDIFLIHMTVIRHNTSIRASSIEKCGVIILNSLDIVLKFAPSVIIFGSKFESFMVDILHADILLNLHTISMKLNSVMLDCVHTYIRTYIRTYVHTYASHPSHILSTIHNQ